MDIDDLGRDGAVGQPRTQRFELGGGVQLTADEWGPRDGYPVLMFHGGGQTRHAWAQAGRVLAEDGWHVSTLDLRGHGESSWPDDADYSLEAFAGDVRQVARRFAVPPVLVGASLGGQAVLTAVGEARAPLASAIVLVDIATRMEQEGFERISGFLRAHREGFASLEEAADAIAAYRGRPRARDLGGLRKNLRRASDGRYYWHWDPRFLDTKADRTSYERRLEDAARALRLPTLLVRGAQSDLLSEEGARHFLDLAPRARFVDVSEAGHMVAGDRNDLFTDSVRGFLAEERTKGTFRAPERAAGAT
jgi:pimeloyl-ACP methyl ester carboxylesterase